MLFAANKIEKKQRMMEEKNPQNLRQTFPSF